VLGVPGSLGRKNKTNCVCFADFESLRCDRIRKGPELLRAHAEEPRRATNDSILNPTRASVCDL
jgi:hypothetical protein